MLVLNARRLKMKTLILRGKVRNFDHSVSLHTVVILINFYYKSCFVSMDCV